MNRFIPVKPLFVTIPICRQLYYERRDRFLAYTLPRIGKRRYLSAKWCACAVSAFYAPGTDAVWDVQPVFFSQMAGAVCCAGQMLLGYWLISLTTLWLGHFCSRSLAVKLIMELYLFAVFWIKLPVMSAALCIPDGYQPLGVAAS